jgi:probable F420-dependent oxidoreductase
MRFGVQVRATAETGNLRDLARRIEEAEFESLWLPEHTHMPVSVGREHAEGADWLAVNMRLFDPFVALAVAAAATTRLRLGTGVCLIPQHNPITLAKQVATLDVLSEGRFLFGVGAGWNEPELAHHGVTAGTQWAVMREMVAALRAIWANEEAEYSGTYLRFDPIWQWPKPVQRPHPPIMVGGEGPHVLRRVVEYGDAWMPNDHPEVVARMAELAGMAKAAGRDPIPVTVYAIPADPARIEALDAAGAARCVFNLRVGDPDDLRWSLAKLGEMIRPYR